VPYVSAAAATTSSCAKKRTRWTSSACWLAMVRQAALTALRCTRIKAEVKKATISASSVRSTASSGGGSSSSEAPSARQ
jgi:hypothetical protein